jgi:hypothetical protein
MAGGCAGHLACRVHVIRYADNLNTKRLQHLHRRLPHRQLPLGRGTVDTGLPPRRPELYARTGLLALVETRIRGAYDMIAPGERGKPDPAPLPGSSGSRLRAN